MNDAQVVPWARKRTAEDAAIPLRIPSSLQNKVHVIRLAGRSVISMISHRLTG